MPSSAPVKTRAQERPKTAELVHLPDKDVRRKRPPLLSFLLRMDTARSAARVVLLLALDFVAVFGAIYTALALKDAVLGDYDANEILEQTRDLVAVTFLITALLFGRSDLDARRSVRPGLTRIVAGLFQVMLVALGYALLTGQEFSSYYLFCGSLAFAVVYVSALRYWFDRATGMVLRAAGYRRRALLVGTGEHIEAVAHALGVGSS